VSLYSKGNAAGNEEDRSLLEALADRTEANPEDLVIDKERVADLEAAIDRELSPFEKQVLDLYLTGMKYGQIAKVLCRDEKSTDNALQRLKAKIRKML
jgi:RNA polymerase sporulation-specific sigma factor